MCYAPLHYVTRTDKRFWFGEYCEAHRQTALRLLATHCINPYALDF